MMHRSSVAAFIACLAGLNGNAAIAQTASPSVLPPAPAPIEMTDRAGIDLTSGRIADVNLERVSIGNRYAGLSAIYGSNQGLSLTSSLTLERVPMYNGGWIIARVQARGQVYLFSLGTITQFNPLPPLCAQFCHVYWTFTPFGTSTTTATSDTIADGSGVGANLVCSGPSAHIYKSGTCSIYLADGSRTDFPMPTSTYDLNLLNQYPSAYVPLQDVVYAWPSQIVLADGEVLTFTYNNYADYNEEAGVTPPPSTWNAVDSSLGFRIYVSNSTPTSTPNPGAWASGLFLPASGSLYAINTSREYAAATTTSRSFSASAMSSVRMMLANGYSLTNNGVLSSTITYAGNLVDVTSPLGGVVEYANIRSIVGPIVTNHGANGAVSTPSDAFPSLSFSATRRSTRNYAVSVNVGSPFETYTATVTNADSSTDSYIIHYGLLRSHTDGLGRTTTFDWLDGEGFFQGLPAYSHQARIAGVHAPDGSSITYNYTHGAVSSAVTTPAGGGAPLTTTIGLPASCTVANYRICNKPTYIRDPLGHQADFTYDPVHGGILIETSPADANGVRAQRRYSYSQLTPRILNSSGVLVNGTPVWRLTRSSECRSATNANPASCVGAATETVTTYAYDDNNLFLTSTTVAGGDGSNTATTTYSYNYAGDVIVTDGPRTDVDDRQYTTYDALRRKVFEIGPDPDAGGALPRIIVRHVYDADGNEVRREFGSGSATDGSDFTVSRFQRMTYDAVSGLLLRTEEVTP